MYVVGLTQLTTPNVKWFITTRYRSKFNLAKSSTENIKKHFEDAKHLIRNTPQRSIKNQADEKSKNKPKCLYRQATLDAEFQVLQLHRPNQDIHSYT